MNAKAVATIGTAAITAAACAVNPATGERQLSLISEQQEVQMGREAAKSVRQTLGFVDDAQLQDYVGRVGSRLARGSERPELPWEFHVVDDPVPNAFALPGGFIYVTRGMLNLMTSEAQLASVLGHEIGHVTGRHSVNQLSKQQLAQIGLGLGSVLVPEVRPFQSLLGGGLGLLFLKYSRDHEREADTLGFEYIQEQRYDVTEFADVFRALEQSAPEGEGALPGWLTTHPAPGERVKTAEARAVEVGDVARARVGRDDYLRQIDDLVYGKDPRDGFFRDGTFYHPRLRFQVQFPSGWQTENLAEAVIAAAPENRAMIQLTLAGRRSPQDALAQFYQNTGVQPGSAARATVNGQPAALGQFQARTDQGVIGGLVGFVTYRNQTYQMIGYSAAQQYDEYATAFERAIRSFAPATTTNVLDVEPQRIDVVQLSNPTTVREFVRQRGSPVSADEIALINQVGDSNALLPAGLVKRIVGPSLD